MTFFWYDYETWGKNPLVDRIVQFGGIRTDENLERVGKEIDLVCKPGLDCPIGPGAVSVHGIMPMEAHKKGLSEAEFAFRIQEELSTPDTCNVAYNGMNFDHELTRVLFYRNLRDPYRWSWDQGNSMWDTIDLMRAACLLFPEALHHWPKKEGGSLSFRLEHLCDANLDQQTHHHSAIQDVIHMWKLARLLRQRALPLWEYALRLRDKKFVRNLLEYGEPVLYTVGKITPRRYCSTIVSDLRVGGRDANEIYTFDLSHDPALLLKPYAHWTDEDKEQARVGIRSLECNKSPFVCKWSEVNSLISPHLTSEEVMGRIELNLSQVLARHESIQNYLDQEFENPFDQYILEIEAAKRERFSSVKLDSDAAIYEGFISDQDQRILNRVIQEGANFDWRTVQTNDSRIEPLIFRYLARNYPEIREGDAKERWYAYCRSRQFEKSERRKVSKDQIFSYELRDRSTPLGNLDPSKVAGLIGWQDLIRKRLILGEEE